MIHQVYVGPNDEDAARAAGGGQCGGCGCVWGGVPWRHGAHAGHQTRGKRQAGRQALVCGDGHIPGLLAARLRAAHGQEARAGQQQPRWW